MKTAVEYLWSRLAEIKKTIPFDDQIEAILNAYHEAKQMEKKQMINSFNQGYTQCSIEDLKPTSRDRYVDAEDYINKTFKSE